jgi:ATP-binding cassette subfamily F protein 3
VEALGANFLILDEPTNHLDIAGREAIEEALEEFDGTLLVVSHDRYFLDKIADKVVEIRERKLELFSGNFSEFWRSRSVRGRSLAERRRTDQAERRGRRTVGSAKPKTGESAVSDAASKAAGNLESRIEKLEGERGVLESEIAKAFESGDHKLGSEKSKKLSSLSRVIEKLYKEWEDFS